jgi:predicted AAA+ superfamily ATPase
VAAIYTELNQLLVFRNLLGDDVVNGLQALAEADTADDNEYALAAILIEWAEATGVAGNIPENYVLGLIGCDSNIFSSTAEKLAVKAESSLQQAVVHDIAILKKLLAGVSTLFSADVRAIIADYRPLTGDAARKSRSFRNLAVLRDLFFDVENKYSPQALAAALARYYHHYGCGKLAGYSAFKWDSREREIVGIEHTDPVQLSDIIGYDYQKNELIRNTEAFIQGRPANNVLLVGARGTGKSSSVKAVANHYFEEGLRLIEIAKSDFECIPEIMSVLRQWGKKCILFIDDLSFEEFEAEYKVLKSLIDGGMEIRPDNVLIYATSNRRNLIKETWDDRSGDELHRQDTINEKISLADRFGITLFYPLPNQEEYFKIVEDIALRNGIRLTGDELRTKALRWEMSHSGRSGRLAKQFIDYLAGGSSDPYPE